MKTPSYKPGRGYKYLEKGGNIFSDTWKGGSSKGERRTQKLTQASRDTSP